MATEPKTIEKVAVQYLVDKDGKRTAVLLPIEELAELAEQVDDIRHLEANKDAPGEPIPWEQFKAELCAEGKLRPEPDDRQLAPQ